MRSTSCGTCCLMDRAWVPKTSATKNTSAPPPTQLRSDEFQQAQRCFNQKSTPRTVNHHDLWDSTRDVMGPHHDRSFRNMSSSPYMNPPGRTSAFSILPEWGIPERGVMLQCTDSPMARRSVHSDKCFSLVVWPKNAVLGNFSGDNAR